MLIFPLYVPFVDTSEPKYFIPLYIQQVYFCILCTVEAYVSIFNYMLMPHNVRTLYGVLNKYAIAVGRKHLNETGVRVFYTNISRGEYVAANLSENYDKQIERAAGDISRAQYEYFYLKKIVQFEQDLREIREKVSSDQLEY